MEYNYQDKQRSYEKKQEKFIYIYIENGNKRLSKDFHFAKI